MEGEKIAVWDVGMFLFKKINTIDLKFCTNPIKAANLRLSGKTHVVE